MRLFLLFYALIMIFRRAQTFEDKTSETFGDRNRGIMAAFGDFNYDKKIDIFSIGLNRTYIEVFESSVDNSLPLRPQLISSPDIKGQIRGIMPGDFDGDSFMDLLVVQTDGAKKYFQIIWGAPREEDRNIPRFNVSVIYTFSREPLLFDFDGDRTVDLLISVDNDAINRTVYSFKDRNMVSTELAKSTGKSMLKAHSNSFVCIDHFDKLADLMVTNDNYMEIYRFMSSKRFEPLAPRQYPNPENSQNSESLFVDFNSDGMIDHVVKVLEGGSSVVYVFDHKNKTWQSVFRLLRSVDKMEWKTNEEFPLGMKSADVNSDGYPDFIVLVLTTDQKSKVILLVNEPCKGSKLCYGGRKLTVQSNVGDLAKFEHVVLATFFDIGEDGVIDIILVNGTDVSEQNGYRMHALKSTYAEDAYFLKVLAVSGLCCNDSSQSANMYQVNQPGPVIWYSIEDSNGKPRDSMGQQLYQSAHFSLQLPYVAFGLGQSPNYVERVELTMPGFNSSRYFPQVIPNAHVVIVPKPPYKPEEWQIKLFLKPSAQVLITWLALCGTCVVITLIILALHMDEKRQDRIERQQQAHRFHFDAM